MQNIFDTAKSAYDNGEYSAALEQFNAVVQSDIGNWDARLYLGMTQVKLGDLESAAKTFRFVNQRCPASGIRLKALQALDSIEKQLASGESTAVNSSISRIMARPKQEELRAMYEVKTSVAVDAADSEIDLEQFNREKERVEAAKKAAAKAEAEKADLPPDATTFTPGIPEPGSSRRARLKFAAVLIAFALVYLAYAGYASTFPSLYASWFLRPEHKQMGSISLPPNAQKEELTFTGPGGIELSALHVKTGSDRVVLINRATTGSITDDLPLVEAIARSGVNVFIYDYPGFGISAGKPDVNACMGAGLLAHENLVGRYHYDREKITVLGSSIGAPIAAYIAKDRGAHSVVLVNAPESLPSLARSHNPLLFLYPDAVLPAQSFNVANDFAASHPQRALLLTSPTDPMVPGDSTKNYYAKVTEPKVLDTMKTSTDFQPIVNFVKD